MFCGKPAPPNRAVAAVLPLPIFADVGTEPTDSFCLAAFDSALDVLPLALERHCCNLFSAWRRWLKKVMAAQLEFFV
jgi:hypothetical protein